MKITREFLWVHGFKQRGLSFQPKKKQHYIIKFNCSLSDLDKVMSQSRGTVIYKLTKNFDWIFHRFLWYGSTKGHGFVSERQINLILTIFSHRSSPLTWQHTFSPISLTKGNECKLCNTVLSRMAVNCTKLLKTSSPYAHRCFVFFPIRRTRLVIYLLRECRKSFTVSDPS